MPLIAVLAYVSTFAQTVERNSASLPAVSDALSTLSGVSGWSKNHLDQWKELPNAIPYRGKSAIELSQFTDKNLGVDNFTKLEMRTVTLGGKVYPALAIFRKVGMYLYPAIREKWVERTDCRLFVFKELPNILPEGKPDNTAFKVRFKPHTFAEVHSVDLASSLNTKIQEELQTSIKAGAVYDDAGAAILDLSKIAGELGGGGDSMKMQSSLRFNILVFPVLYEGKRSVRFLFDYDMKIDGVPGDTNFLSRAGETGGLYDERIGSETSEFDKWYFEAPRDAFLKFWSSYKSDSGAGPSRQAWVLR